MSDNNTSIVAFKKDLKAAIPQMALPANVSPEAFQSAAVVAVQENPRILQHDAATVFRALRKCAADGLVPDGREAALVHYGGKNPNLVYMPMVAGLLKRLYNTGLVKSITAHVVYMEEFQTGRFDYVAGDDERLDHRPLLFGERGERIAVYAIAHLEGGRTVRCVMTAEEVEKVRQSSRAKDSGPWVDWTDEMWIKSAIRRLVKRLPLKSEDQEMIQESGDSTMRDITPPRESLADRIKRENEPAEPEADSGSTDPAEQPDKVHEGEIVPDDPAQEGLNEALAEIDATETEEELAEALKNYGVLIENLPREMQEQIDNAVTAKREMF